MSTDNAYVHAGKLTVATDVSGIVADVAVKESQKVEKGQVLFTLDQEPFRIALAGAEANLGTVRNQLATLQATYRQKQAQIEQAKTDVAFYETGFQRQQDLLKRGVASQAAFDQAKRDLDAARERVTMAQHDAEATLAQLGGNADAPIEQNASYLAAQAQVDKAKRDSRAPPCWRRSRASSPMSMRCRSASTCRRRSRPSAWSRRPTCGSRPIPRRSDLAYLKPGAPAVVTIDAYPGRDMAGDGDQPRPATGTEFSVLPAQNATGNWVKVVQRVPIRARRADAGRRAAIAHRHERHGRDRHRPSPRARRPRGRGAAVHRDVDSCPHSDRGPPGPPMSGPGGRGPEDGRL